MRLFRLSAATFAACLALPFGAAFAAPTAIDLVFETPALKNASDGSTISYRFVRKTEDKRLEAAFEDQIAVQVGPSGATNSVTIDMFTGARAKQLQNMARSGNPVIVAVMEREVQEMQKQTGGSPFYIRNRIMDAIRNQDVQAVKVNYGGRELDGWRFLLMPFANDQNKAKLQDFAGLTYELTFADEAPGGLVSLRSVTPKKDGGDLVVEELTLQPQQAADAGAKQ
jgi:hypothetical protein